MSRDNKTPFYKYPKRNISTALPTSTPLPKKQVSNNPITQNSGGGIMQTIKDGFATGIGFSLADRLVASFMGPRKVEVVHTTQTTNELNCNNINKEYNKLFEDGMSISEELKNKFEQCNKRM
jgi:hypothetical protein